MKIILISQCVDVIDMCYFESGTYQHKEYWHQAKTYQNKTYL